MAEFDPSRAKPETVARLLYELQFLVHPEALHVTARDALEQLRSECRIPLRTRAEVDAEIALLTRQCVENEWAGDDDYDVWVAVTKLCYEPTSDSGPSSADAADGDGPLPPSVPVSPAGADLIQRLELVERYIGPSALAWARGQHWHCPTDCECRAVPASGPPGAAAAKESSDTTAAAPALKATVDRFEGYMRDVQFLHRQWSDENALAGSVLTRIGSVVLRWMSNLP